MKKVMILLTIAALVCLTFTAMAAGDGIAFDTSVSAINEGETLQTVLTREGEAAEGEVTYTSSNQKMATVDENGLVTAIRKGRVVITATVKAAKKSYRAQLKLDIIRPVTAVTLNESKLEVHAAGDEQVAQLLTARENAEENELPVIVLPVKKRIALAATVEPKDASNRNLTFTGSDDSVFTAVRNNITGVAPGEAILTIASESTPEVAIRYRVLVVQPATKITIESSEPAVIVGQQVTVSATVMPENATVKGVNWKSGDERIVTVDEKGTVSGIKRGNGRVIAIAADGSNVRANFNIKVIQNPENIALSESEMTIDIGKMKACKAKVEPANTDNKKVIWTSSDESIATVDRNGRIKGIAVGDCTITCTSEALDTVSSSLTVHIQLPVKKVTFNDKTALVYVDEDTQLKWSIEPADATNQQLTFKSSNEKVVTVDENGVIHGIASGKAKITATTTDGSRRTASIAVQAGKHATGVHMVRKHAYIDVGETATASAVVEPKDALNHNMSWASSDTDIVTAAGNTNQGKLTGVAKGDAVVTGTTEDGGFETSIQVTVGYFDKGVEFVSDHVNWHSGNVWLSVKNRLQFNITQITAVLELWDASGEDLEPAVINTANGGNKVDVVWTGRLRPGSTTGKDGWRMVNFMTPACGMKSTRGRITIVSFQINGDWVKNIRNRPSKYWN